MIDNFFKITLTGLALLQLMLAVALIGLVVYGAYTGEIPITIK